MLRTYLRILGLASFFTFSWLIHPDSSAARTALRNPHNSDNVRLASRMPVFGQTASSGLAGRSSDSLASQISDQGIQNQAAQAAITGQINPVQYDWLEISGIGKKIPLQDWIDWSGEFDANDDDGQALVSLPWSFPWFDGSSNAIYVDANGNIKFDPYPLEGTYFGENRIPVQAEPNNRIAAFFEDLAGPDSAYCDGEDAVYTCNDQDNNRFIIQYNKWCSIFDQGLDTFQVILYSNGNVVVQYKDVPTAPPDLFYGNSDTGVESPDGMSGVRWESGIANGIAWMYDRTNPSSPIFSPDLVYNVYLPSISKPGQPRILTCR